MATKRNTLMANLSFYGTFSLFFDRFVSLWGSCRIAVKLRKCVEREKSPMRLIEGRIVIDSKRAVFIKPFQ